MEIGIDSFAAFVTDAKGNPVGTAHDALRELLDRIQLADEKGLDVFAIGEHHRKEFLDSATSVILAAAASRTSRIRLSSAVTVLSAADPVRVFQQFATLDLLSQGRAELVVGRGSFTEAFPLFGLNFQDSEYTTMDGPVICYMGETSEDLQRYFRNWNELTEFSYKKEHGYGYGGIVCGIWSLTIPMSGFKLRWNEMPFVPHHVYSDRY